MDRGCRVSRLPRKKTKRRQTPGIIRSLVKAVLWSAYGDHSITLSPASKASREVANLDERKNPHTPVYGVKEYVCLWSTLTSIISVLAKHNWLKKILGQLWQNECTKNFVCRKSGRLGQGPGPKQHVF